MSVDLDYTLLCSSAGAQLSYFLNKVLVYIAIQECICGMEEGGNHEVCPNFVPLKHKSGF